MSARNRRWRASCATSSSARSRRRSACRRSGPRGPRSRTIIRTKAEPMKPAPPVTMILIAEFSRHARPGRRAGTARPRLPPPAAGSAQSLSDRTAAPGRQAKGWRARVVHWMPRSCSRGCSGRHLVDDLGAGSSVQKPCAKPSGTNTWFQASALSVQDVAAERRRAAPKVHRHVEDGAARHPHQLGLGERRRPGSAARARCPAAPRANGCPDELVHDPAAAKARRL